MGTIQASARTARTRLGGSRRLRRGVLAAPVLAVLLSASACLVPSGTIRQVHPNTNLPDPAAVHVWGDWAQVYATNSWIFWGSYANVPTFSYDLSNGNTGSLTDALPDEKLPSWVQPNVSDGVRFVWAPTVRQVGGKFLMMFTASQRSGWACIGAAYSNTAVGPFTPTSMKWCNPGAGLLDPQIFVNGDGTVWVHYSEQYPDSRASSIQAQRITFNGTSVSKVGGPTKILTLADARSVCGLRHPVTSCTVNPGAAPANHVVENPAMVRDPHNGYNLLVSVGNWRDNTYRTVEVPCTAPNGGCTANFGAPIQESSTEMRQKGGASLLRDDTPTNNHLFFHARRSGSDHRTTHVQGTVAIAGT